MASRETLEILLRAKTAGMSSFKQANTQLDQMERRTKGINLGFGAMTRSLLSIKGLLLGGGLAAGIGLIGRQALGTAAQFEAMEKSMDQFTGGKGAQKLTELKNEFKDLPVMLSDVLDGFTSLNAYGVDPTTDKLKILTDVAAVMGREAFPRVARAIGQMQTLGKVSAEELNQLSEVGIKARQYLQDEFNMNVEEFQRSGLEVEKAIAAIWKGMEKDFGGAAGRMQNTWRGLTIQLKKLWQDFTLDVMQGGEVFDYLKAALEAIVTQMKDLKERGQLDLLAKETAERILKTLQTMVNGVRLVEKAVIYVGFAWKGINLLVNLAIEMIGGLGVKIAGLLEVISRVVPGINDDFREMRDMMQASLDVQKEKTDQILMEINRGHERLKQLGQEESILSNFVTLTNQIFENNRKAAEQTKQQTAELANAARIAGTATQAGAYLQSGSPQVKEARGKLRIPSQLEPYADRIIAESVKYGIDPALVMANIMVESSGNTRATGSPTKYGRAKGLFQFIDPTGRQYGLSPQDAYDPNKSIPAGVKFISDLVKRSGGDADTYVKGYYGAPDQKYKAALMRNYQKIAGGGSPFTMDPSAAMGEIRSAEEEARQQQTRIADARVQSELTRTQETVKNQLEVLDRAYEQGEVTLTEYFDKRKAKIEELAQAELAALEKTKAAEEDPAQKIAIEDKIFQVKAQNERELAALAEERAEAEQRVAERRLQIEQALQNKAFGLQRDTLENRFAQEQAALERQQQEEIKRLQDLNATKAQIEEAYRLQEMERDKLAHEQYLRLLDARYQMASDIAGGISNAFEEMYELTGKKQKEFFYLSKAAAIAQATINVSQAVTKALAQGGFFGYAQAAMITTKGAVQIAKIYAQKMAAGGEVKGWSPSATADNIPARLTAGEFVQPVDVVKHYGVRAMEKLRKKAIPRVLLEGPSLPRPAYGFATGGLVGGGRVPDGASPGQAAMPTIVNILDKSEIADYLGSADGQNVILNVMNRNASVLRRMSGE
jgi:tape measure domain-containing protein